MTLSPRIITKRSSRRSLHTRMSASYSGELSPSVTAQIKNADRGAAYLEATMLAGFSPTEAKRLFGRDPGLPESVREDYLPPWSAAKAEKRFLARFNSLQA